MKKALYFLLVVIVCLLPIKHSPAFWHGTPDAAATTAFLARTSGLSAIETAAYKALINGLVSDGDFASLIGLYRFNTKDRTTAKLNLIQNAYNLTEHGTVTFVSDVGYFGDGSTFYLDTGYIPSVNGGLLNSTSMGFDIPLSRTAAHSWVGMGASTTSGGYAYLGAYPTLQYEVNAANFPTQSNANAQGLWAVSRTSSGTVNVYKNNSATPVATASDTSTSLPTTSVLIFAYNNNVGGPTGISGDLMSGAYFGVGLTAAAVVRINNRINTFIATVTPGMEVYNAVPSVTLGAVTKYNSGYPTKYVASDTFASTWADNDNIYTTNDDTANGGSWQAVAPSSNMMVSQLSNATTSMTGTTINVMSAFGTFTQTGSDGKTYKSYSLISVNGVLYATTVRQAAVPDGAFRYSAANAQIIKSTDHGLNWTPQPPSTANPYASPQFSNGFLPSFIQYGKDYVGQTVDNSNLYVYATSNNGYWNNGDALYLGRCLISAMPNLSASDWTYYKGNSSGDITDNANWDATFSNAVPIISSTKKVSLAGAQYVAAKGKYYLFGWYYVTVAAGQAVNAAYSIWTLQEASNPRGPWTVTQNIFWPTTGLYDARVIPKSVSGGTLMLGTAGNFGSTDPQTGDYTLTLVPVTINWLLQRDVDPASNDNSPMWLEKVG